MIEQILEAWRINQRVNSRLIGRISDAGMRCTLSQRGGRSVVRQFTHLQYVRVFQLTRRAKTLAKGAHSFEPTANPTGSPRDESRAGGDVEGRRKRSRQEVVLGLT